MNDETMRDHIPLAFVRQCVDMLPKDALQEFGHHHFVAGMFEALKCAMNTRAQASAPEGGNCVLVDRGALKLALSVLDRSGKDEVADALRNGVFPQGEVTRSNAKVGEVVLSDEQCDAIYEALDTWATDIDSYEFGLPQISGDGRIGGRVIIRNALSAHDKTKA